MLANLTHFSDSSSGLGALGVDAHAFIIQLITFILAFLVLKRWAFKPIIKILLERRETIEQGVKLGEQMRQEKAQLEAKTEDVLRSARQQADEIISAAQDSGRQAVREAEEKARAKAEGIVSAAEERIKQDTARARQALESEVVGLIADTASAVIGEKVDARKDAQLIERVLKEQKA